MLIEVRLVHIPEKLRRLPGYWRAFKYAYVAFLVWNIGGCYWLLFTGHGLPDPSMRFLSTIAGILALVLNPMLQSIPVLGFVFLRRRLAAPWALTGLVAFYISFEYLHLHWELTWSWLNLGHVFAAWPWYSQYLEFTGVLGASAFLLIAAALLFSWLRSLNWRETYFYAPRALAVLLVAPLVLWPLLTLPFRDIYQPTGSLRVRVVQPNIDPYNDKFDDAPLEVQLQKLEALIAQPGLDTIDLVVLPETAIPRRVDDFTLNRNPALRPIWQPAGNTRVAVLTGMVYYRIYNNNFDQLPVSARCAYPDATSTTPMYCWDTWNAATLFAPGVQAIPYQKGKLVPFSERVPYMETLEMLKAYEIDLGGGFGSFGLPDSLHILHDANGTGILPIICYESIFGDHVRYLTAKGAHLLCVLTNDGWWKQSSGYLQHAAYARQRAIETRRWVARSANTGQSCFISPLGNLHQPTEWWVPTTIDRRIDLLKGQTFYTRYGDWLGQLAVILSLLLLLGWPFALKFWPSSFRSR
jgi:apolipoprotein N-acyltransferase